jgi:hypothetical protein
MGSTARSAAADDHVHDPALPVRIASPRGWRAAERAQELIGHANERTASGIYTHVMKRKNDDSGDDRRARRSFEPRGNIRDTSDDAAAETRA